MYVRENLQNFSVFAKTTQKSRISLERMKEMHISITTRYFGMYTIQHPEQKQAHENRLQIKLHCTMCIRFHSPVFDGVSQPMIKPTYRPNERQEIPLKNTMRTIYLDKFICAFVSKVLKFNLFSSHTPVNVPIGSLLEYGKMIKKPKGIFSFCLPDHFANHLTRHKRSFKIAKVFACACLFTGQSYIDHV